MIGPKAGRDEDRGGGDAGGHVGSVPGAGRVDRIVAGGERHAFGGAVGMLLVEREGAGGADHHLGAVRVDLPHRPAFGEVILRDQAALDPVGGVAGGVVGVPLHAGEGRLDSGGGAEAEMGGGGGEMGHGAADARI